jgi:hypothetical protein
VTEHADFHPAIADDSATRALLSLGVAAGPIYVVVALLRCSAGGASK